MWLDTSPHIGSWNLIGRLVKLRPDYLDYFLIHSIKQADWKDFFVNYVCALILVCVVSLLTRIPI